MRKSSSSASRPLPASTSTGATQNQCYYSTVQQQQQKQKSPPMPLNKAPAAAASARLACGLGSASPTHSVGVGSPDHCGAPTSPERRHSAASSSFTSSGHHSNINNNNTLHPNQHNHQMQNRNCFSYNGHQQQQRHSMTSSYGVGNQQNSVFYEDDGFSDSEGHHSSAGSSPLAHRKVERSHSDPQGPGAVAAVAAILFGRELPDERLGLAKNRYKTELCRAYLEAGHCKYGEKCQFAHGKHDLRVVNRHPKYKTENCRSFFTTGICQYGMRCHFIHHLSESAAYNGGLQQQQQQVPAPSNRGRSVSVCVFPASSSSNHSGGMTHHHNHHLQTVPQQTPRTYSIGSSCGEDSATGSRSSYSSSPVSMSPGLAMNGSWCSSTDDVFDFGSVPNVPEVSSSSNFEIGFWEPQASALVDDILN
ncbi:putative Protein TIS11 [Hypsibius exemplaris]|uniref:C3H1-type domain-containing protein n=1 Tax=Hypsibius exemplaris TaxID=2072580 RepID=A0A9X6NDM1_HYPEX|nr:putative Protein TIS11 [Hypsibius exemplaris]